MRCFAQLKISRGKSCGISSQADSNRTDRAFADMGVHTGSMIPLLCRIGNGIKGVAKRVRQPSKLTFTMEKSSSRVVCPHIPCRKR